ncbi:glycosyltransferase family 4 protein [Clostridium mediterraneense]|uniref:glycosyltransferase family 4 protein n=1 Tax=Clostridium mediterraneense TaxID=1805472 RepID=UPI00082C3DEA|nr:glycosyltransferase family 4 protein [Clostridium mediterraneense]
MRIAILLSDINSQGGVARTVTNLANAFDELTDYSIDIISCFKSCGQEQNYKINENISVKYLNIDINIKTNKIYKQIYFIKEIKKNLSYKDYDFIISTNAHLNIYSYLSLIGKKKTKLIACEHGAYNHLEKGWRFITKLIYRKVDKLILLTSKEIDLYKKFCKSIDVIPNILSFESDYISKQNNNKIISVGRIDTNKNYIDLIRAFAAIESKYSNWSVDIIGDGTDAEVSKLKKEIEKLNLKSKIVILNFTKNIKEFYLNSDIYVMTSKSEGLPMVLLEAMNCGLPCISYDIKTGPSDIIEDNKNGFLVEELNIEMLQSKLSDLIQNKQLRINMGSAAREASKRFKKENIVLKWQEIFSEINFNN